MSALSPEAEEHEEGPALNGGPSRVARSSRFVLPRWLRRPARLAKRLAKGDWTPPRFAASIGAGAFFAATAAYGAALGGHMPAVVEAVSSRTGMALDQVHVTGNSQTSEIDILDRLGLDGWTSLIGFDADAARLRLEALPWVKSAAIRKTYPRTLNVAVVEREPFAVWQHDNQLTVVERDGKPITEYRGRGKSPWPLVVGFGAPEHAADFAQVMTGFPDLAARVKGYIRVGDRRWDVKFDSGVTVRLPDDKPEAALAELSRLQAEQDLLDRDITAVDFRLSDRVVVQLTAQAAEARAASLDPKIKNGKKPAAKPAEPKKEKKA